MPRCTSALPVGLSLLGCTEPTGVGDGGGFDGVTLGDGLNWLTGTPTMLGFGAGLADTGFGGGLVASNA